MNRRNIKISVIMACHNSSAYLDEAVSSVLNQTLGDLELILIDDFSSDNSIEIAKRYQLQDARVRVLSLPSNFGPATARNTGIRIAKGEWLGILDSDDVAMPTRFEEQMRLTESDKGLVIIGSNSISIDKNSDAIKEYNYPTGHQELVKRLYSIQAFPPHSSFVYRRDMVDKLSAFNPKYVPAEDCDLWLRLSEIGKVASIDKPLVKIRKHENNISNLKGGMLQVLFGSTALVCHFLRVHKCPDPSSGSDEAVWKGFLEWIERRMTEEGVFERRKVWADARAEYFERNNRMNGVFHFGIRLLKSGAAVELVREKVFGSSLPERLSREWMKRSCAAS
jgi:Glycosyltransferases involved in cell wall biogenesis